MKSEKGIVGFYDRFELLDLLRDDGVKSFKARELATGRTVEAHLFVNPYAPLSVALLARIDQMTAPERDRILDRGRHEGTPYIVTEPLHQPDGAYPGFREWVMSKRAAAQPTPPPASPPGHSLIQAGPWQIRPVTPPSAIQVPPAPPPPQPAGPPPSTVSEPPPSARDEQFASLFRTTPITVSGNSGPGPQAPALPVPPAPIIETTTMAIPLLPDSSPSNASPPPVKELTHTLEMPPDVRAQMQRREGLQAREGTMIFPAAANPPGEFTQLFSAQRPSTPPQDVPQPPISANSPGEFTQLFAAQKTAPPAPQPAAPANPPGEFTQLFSPQKPAPVAAAPQPPAPVHQPGEFTQLFTMQKPAPLAAAPQPAAPANPPGEFTQLFAMQKPPAAPAPPVSGTQPGEFTRMLQVQPSAPLPQKPVWRPNQLSPANPPSGSRPGAIQPGTNPPGTNQPGEFTRFFQAPIGPMPQSPALQQPMQPVAPANAGEFARGEFTQRFGAAAVPQPPPAAPAAAPPAPGNATQGFSVPVAGYPGYPPAAYDPYNPYGVQPPSDFAQKFAAPAQLTLGQDSVDAAAPVPRQSRIRPYLPLILGLVGILLLVVIVILIFARHR